MEWKYYIILSIYNIIYKMAYERGIVMLAHSAMIGIAIFLMMKFILAAAQI